MDTPYEFIKSPVAADRLEKEIKDSAIVTAISNIVLLGEDNLTVNFKASLSQDDETILNNLVENHTGEPLEDTYIANVKVVEDNSSKDSENANYSRFKIVPSGWTYSAIGIDLKTCQIDSLKVLKNGINDSSINSTYKIYDADDIEITDPANNLLAVKTIITIEPTWDYYLISGQISNTTNLVKCDAIGVPDVPFESGGTKHFAQNLNLKKFTQLQTDGKAPKLLSYNATYHTNKFKFVFYHEVGVAEDISVILELYR